MTSLLVIASINNTQDNMYAEYRILIVVMPDVIILNVVLLNFIMLVLC
jgi:hypothetical protein